MRARYSAHVMVDVDFLYATTHPDHREGYDHKGTRIWAENSEWHGLQILETTGGGPKDEEGEVEFIARFRDKNGLRSHHERGMFERKKKRWLFTEGKMVKSPPLTVNKIGRNDPCSCGSGKKHKKCCGK
jgi:SEC-C motif-containing protein